MGEPLDDFVRRQNVDHYRALLRRTTDERRRKVLLELLAEQEANEGRRPERPIS